ncbi:MULTISPECIES: DUF3710 domain-containing protein [Kocuria]|uniref:DUF3710 domain-containing protein n=1 Tax=Kocuria TaxID=57493 RepID=UPI0020121225|nr:DUF3710 domain-containing protein [Kocuria rosea]
MFGRKKKKAAAQDAAPQQPEAAPSAEDAAAARRREPQGPLDVSQVEDRDGYLDLGAVLVRPRPGLGVRLEVDERTQRPRAVALDLDGGSVQVQAFAAPRSEGLWDEVRRELVQSLRSSNGEPTVEEGPFGLQVVTRFPATASDGTRGFRLARFVGVDGPRWFVRAVFTGTAAVTAESAAALDEVVRELVVVRGDRPMPPRELLTLVVPEDAVRSPVPDTEPEPEPAPEPVRPPRRGPEITEIG